MLEAATLISLRCECLLFSVHNIPFISVRFSLSPFFSFLPRLFFISYLHLWTQAPLATQKSDFRSCFVQTQNWAFGHTFVWTSTQPHQGSIFCPNVGYNIEKIKKSSKIAQKLRKSSRPLCIHQYLTLSLAGSPLSLTLTLAGSILFMFYVQSSEGLIEVAEHSCPRSLLRIGQGIGRGLWAG